MGETAYVVTDALAGERGFASSGPYAFPRFPGVYFVGEPVALRELGGLTEEEIDALAAELNVPVEKTTVEAGEGEAYRVNHYTGPSPADEPAEEAKPIRSHADADRAAAELGIRFAEDPRPTVAEKVAAIEAVRAGQEPQVPVARAENEPAVQGEQDPIGGEG